MPWLMGPHIKATTSTRGGAESSMGDVGSSRYPLVRLTGEGLGVEVYG